MNASASTASVAPAVLPSVSIKIRSRSGWPRWAKVVRAGAPLPLPSTVQGAADIDVPFLRPGDEELFPDDVLFQGVANHPKKMRGWSYWVSYVNAEGEFLQYRSGFSAQKAAAKAQGLRRELLAGSGDVAGAVRVAHALRAGMDLPIT